jgi:hypothetical protein
MSHSHTISLHTWYILDVICLFSQMSENPKEEEIPDVCFAHLGDELGFASSNMQYVINPYQSSIRKRKLSKDAYTEVTVTCIRKVKIYHKEQFDLDTHITVRSENESIVSGVLKFDHQDMDEYVMTNLDERMSLVKDIDCTNSIVTEDEDEWWPIIVMPEKMIRNTYNEGGTLNELRDHVYCLPTLIIEKKE